jgi:conjugative transfer signal peptidase TraF
MLLAAATRTDGLIFVATDSSCPIGIYHVVHQPPARGELVEACLPEAIASYGMARGYLASGECPNGAEPVIKVIGALAGDRVDLSPEEIRVNGTALPQSSTRLRDSRGRAVRTLPRGSYETTADDVWLFGLHDARSWDSRYFGPVPVNAVLGAVDVGPIRAREMRKLVMATHSREQGLRVHHLTNLGGLVAIAGLDSQPPDLLLGALLKIASDLSNSSVELRRQLASLGHRKLDERGAEKRAFNSWLRANNLHNLTLNSEQIARIVAALGSPAPSDRSALVPALNAALDGAR